MTLTMGEFIEKLWDNPEDAKKFEDNPKQFLIDNGEPVSDDVQVYAHIDTASDRSFVLPADKSEIPEDENDALSVVRKAMDDPTFKAKLKEQPKAAFAEEGLQIPEDMSVTVFENTPSQLHIVLPVDPATTELSDADLENIPGGGNDSKRQCEWGKRLAGLYAPAYFIGAGASYVARNTTPKKRKGNEQSTKFRRGGGFGS